MTNYEWAMASTETRVGDAVQEAVWTLLDGFDDGDTVIDGELAGRIASACEHVARKILERNDRSK